MIDLKTTKLYRYLQSGEFYRKKLTFLYIDELGKTTRVRYRIIGLLESHIGDLDNYLCKLDARSISYMKRVVIIENKRAEAEKWKH